jgi:hypothetical protein
MDGGPREASVKQLDMFGAAPPLARPVFTPPEFAPYPDSLLRRLNATLRMVQTAEYLPWPPAEANRERETFLGAVERLPPDRRGDLAEAFEAEMARLKRP